VDTRLLNRSTKAVLSRSIGPLRRRQADQQLVDLPVGRLPMVEEAGDKPSGRAVANIVRIEVRDTDDVEN
jgi:hypothetical protein